MQLYSALSLLILHFECTVLLSSYQCYILNNKLHYILKMSQQQLIMLLCIVIFAASYHCKPNTICVGMADKENCTYVLDDLDFLTSLSTKNESTTVLLFAQHVMVTKTLQVHQLNGFQIKGGLTSTPTTIECSGNSGLLFNGMTNMRINRIVFSKCGGTFNSTSQNSNGLFIIRAGVYLSNCTNVDIIDVVVDQSPGNGMVFYDCTGDVWISNSNFTNNYVPHGQMNDAGGGGVYIEFSECSPEWINNCNQTNNLFNSNGNYHIDNCVFMNNTRVYKRTPDSINHRGSVHGGGGLSLWTRGNSMNNIILITECWFIGNKARYGGGLYFSFRQASYNHRLTIINSTFESNQATSAGGAIDAGTISTKFPFPDHISVLVHGCYFNQNQARFGGGTSIFASIPYEVKLSIQFKYEQSYWQGNKAQFAFAMNLRSVFTISVNYFPPKVTVSDCVFKENESTEERSNTGLAAVHARVFPIILNEKVQFISNKGSGIKLVDSIVIVKHNTSLLFMNNIANFGGGISLIGFSSILVQSNVKINFTNNYANFQGGAIYSYSVDEQPEGICFIEHDREPALSVSYKFPELYFNENKASNKSNSLFVSSARPCSSSCQTHSINSTITELFQDCIGKFDFGQGDIDSQVSTEGSRLVLNDLFIEPLKCIPGKYTSLPFSVLNELGTQTAESFYISITGNDQISLSHHFTANREIEVIGKPGQTGQLNINSVNFRNLATTINITLTECPPGFIIADQKTCICSTLKDEGHYVGIRNCNLTNDEMFAYVNYGFWIGYLPDYNESEGEDNLYSSICPQGYCGYEYDPLGIKLPPEALEKRLNQVICGSRNRKGILCGDCIQNNSMLFHSSDFMCEHSDYCDYGILFYFLSELVPVTCLFSVIVLAGFNFNSGKFNGFILFAQLSPSLALMANGAIVYTKTESFLKGVSNFVYGPFNLNFFKINSLSFCIFEGANFFTITLMEILTLVYSLVLIVFLVYVTRSRCCYKLRIICFRRGIARTTSLTNGLAAFLIICYSQTTRLCFQILNVGVLDGKGERIVYSHRVFHMGSIEYFTGIHIPFCVGAILILITVVTIPPVLLLTYPLIYKVMPEQFQKQKQVMFILNKVEKYHPLFDAFQGCFRDKHRYFAGIHFLYRSVFATTYAFISSRLTFYITNQILAILILFIHLTIQPYKRKTHNIIDGLIFFLLLLINMLTLWRYVLSIYQYQSIELFVTGIIQLLLLLVPAIAVILYLLCKSLPRRLNIIKKKQQEVLKMMDLIDSNDSFINDLDLRYREYSDTASIQY